MSSSGQMLSARFDSATAAAASPVRGSLLVLPSTVQQVSELFVAALTGDSDHPWQSLLQYLRSLSPATIQYLGTLPEVQHYLHRVVQHVLKHRDRLEHLEVIETLAVVFPDEVEALRSKELPFSYSYSDLNAATAEGRMGYGEQGRIKKKRRRAASVGPSTGDLFRYSPNLIPATYRGPLLTAKDLGTAVTVVCDQLTHEGKTTSRLPPYSRSDAISPQRPRSSQGFYKSPSRRQEMPYLLPVLKSELNSSAQHPDISPCKKSKQARAHFHPSFLHSRPLELTNGYDVVHAFASGQLQSGSESVYLNYADSKPWNPYSLVVVLKTRVDPEHFVVSKFGIVRVFASGESSVQSFAEWLREAGLFTLLQQIPFFKCYLLRKFIKRWHKVVRYRQFIRVCTTVSKSCLRLFPGFSDALLKIQSLNEELLTVPFHVLVPFGGYSQEMFDRSIQTSQTKAQRFLQRYFKYCRRVVAEAIEAMESLALELETEKRHQPFVSDLPLSVQKEKHAKLERDLVTAQHRVRKIDRFITLADQMVADCLLQLAMESTQHWARVTLKQKKDSIEYSSDVQPRNVQEQNLGKGTAFLCAQMKLEGARSLTTTPSQEELESYLSGPLYAILHIISKSVQPLTGPLLQGSDSPPMREASLGLDSPRTSSELSTRHAVDAAKVSTDGALDYHRVLTREKVTAVLSRAPPHHKPKSVLKALQGITGRSADVDPGGPMLESERAKLQLAIVTQQSTKGLGGREDGTAMAARATPFRKEEMYMQLSQHPLIASVLQDMQSAVSDVCGEIESLCQKNEWLGELWKFLQQWEDQDRTAKLTPNEFQVALTQVYEWRDKLSHLPPHLPTPHSLVCVLTSDVVGAISPRLSAILDQLKSRGVEGARREGERVLTETKVHSEALSLKRYDLEGFAEYSKQLRESKVFHEKEASNVQYILRVHRILLHHGVDVPGEDRVLSQVLQQAWQVFVERLVQGEEFVSAQTPVKAQGLLESITSCEEELLSLVSAVNTGRFVDPNAVPSELICQLKTLEEEVMTVRARLLGLSKWKEAISEQPHDLSSVSRMMNMLYGRLELWKYRRVFDDYERDWSKTPFKKLDINLLSQKVSQWLDVCSKLEKTLPPTDPVLEAWKERLTDLEKGMPLLQQLSSKALRASHWYTIFAAFGEDYNSLQQYTLTDFALFNIFKHRDIIFEICHDAMQEERLKAQVLEMEAQWTNQTVSVIQTPIGHYPFALPSNSNDRPPTPKKQGDKVTTFALSFDPSHHESQTTDCLYTVGNDGDILLQLEHAMTQLKLLLGSPHIGNLKERAESLLATLRQLWELLTLVAECQWKWFDLLKFFLAMESSARHSCGLDSLQRATARYQEVTQSIRDDPRLLSLLEKRRGQKGFRELQGDSLRHSLEAVLSSLELVMKEVRSALDDACSLFPRLCYLRDHDVLTVVSHKGSPALLSPLIARVYPCISTVRFTELVSSTTPSHSKSEKGFQIVEVVGGCGEPLPLVVPLPLGNRPAPQWLQALEGAMRYSLSCELTDSLATLPEPLMGINADDGSSLLSPWLSSHPLQALLLALDLKWSAAIQSSLTSEEPVKCLQGIRSRLHTAIEIAVEALRVNHSSTPVATMARSSESSRSQSVMLGNIISSLKHKADVVRALVKQASHLPAESFIWKSHIHYTLASQPSEVNDTRSIRSSVTSFNKLGGVKSSGRAVSVKSCHSSLGQRSLLLPYKSDGSTKSLVASSKDLLNSRHTLSSVATQMAVPTACCLSCNNLSLVYGFEYHGVASRLVLTPPTESHLVSLMTSLGAHVYPAVSGPSGSGKSETTAEAAKVLGRHCHSIDCRPHTDLHCLRHLLAGALRAGSVLLLEGYTKLQLPTLLSLGEMLAHLGATLGRLSGEKSSSPTEKLNPSERSEVTLLMTANHTPSVPSLRPSSAAFTFSRAHSSQHHRPGTSRTSTRIDWYTAGTSDYWPLRLGDLAEVVFAGQCLLASPSFGCVLLDNMTSQEARVIPDRLKAFLRPIPLVPPSTAVVAETLLLCAGYAESHSLARRLSEFLAQIKTQLSTDTKGYLFGLRELKAIIYHSVPFLADRQITSISEYETDEIISTSFEAQAITHGIAQVYDQGMSPGDKKKFQELVEFYFPVDSDQGGKSTGDPVLMDALRGQLKERHLQCTKTIRQKIFQLSQSLRHHTCTVLYGPSGSGKTTCYQTLVAAYQHILEIRAATAPGEGGSGEEQLHDRYPQVDLSSINPGAYSYAELFGSQHMELGRWKDGILTRLLRTFTFTDNLKTTLAHPDGNTSQMAGAENSIQHWIVLDGPMNPVIMEVLSVLVSKHGLSLPNGEMIHLPASCRLLIETTSLSDLPPSLLTLCGTVHCGAETVTPDELVETWLDRAPTQHNLSALSTETLGSMITDLLPDTLDFIRATNTKHSGPACLNQLQVHNSAVQETHCFLTFLSAMLERNAPKIDSSTGYLGASTASRISRTSSHLTTDSRASSALLQASSSALMHGTPQRMDSHQASRVSMQVESEAQSLAAEDQEDVLSECSNLEAEIGFSMQIQIASMLAFAYIWSFGAFIPWSEVSSFDEFARDTILQLPFAVSIPEEGLVFDYYLDLKGYVFLPWSDRQRTKGRAGGGGYIALPELERFAYIADLYLSFGSNVMIVGSQGTGKSSFVQQLIQSRMPLTRLPITHTLTAVALQGAILDKVAQLERRVGQKPSGKKYLTTAVSQKCVFFLDDLHLARASDEALHSTKSTIPLVELLRYAASQGSLPDYWRNYQHDLHNIRYIASCTPDGFSRLSPRLAGTFHPILFLPPSDECLQQIFSKNVIVWLQQFPETAMGETEVLAEAIAVASVAVFRSIANHFQCTPSQPQLLFTMHDLLRVYDGLLLLTPDTKAQSQPQFSLLNRRGFLSSVHSGASRGSKTARRSKASGGKLKSGRRERPSLPSLKGGESSVRSRPKARSQSLPLSTDQAEVVSTLRMLLRLWCHENTRVYVDRVTDSKDRMWFVKLLEMCMKYCFCGNDLQGGGGTAQLGGGHTATHGGRRIRGGRSNLPQSEGPSLADLAKSGIKIDTLQKLMPKESLKQLIHYDQLVMRGEDLSRLIFAQLPVEQQGKVGGATPSDDSQTEEDQGSKDTVSVCAYSELGDGQVMDALNHHLKTHHYQKEDIQLQGVVLFREAIEHATRLCRVLNLPGSHVLLLGAKGTGRKSLIRLMSHVMDVQLFELFTSSSDEGTQRQFKQQLRQVCITAGLEGQHTALLIDRSGVQNELEWESICELMNRGICRGLFSSSELLVMSSKLQQGGLKKTKDGAQQAFARSIRSHLHVLVVWNLDSRTSSPFATTDAGQRAVNALELTTESSTSGQPLHQWKHEESMRTTFVSLCRSCNHIDHYLPWSKQAYGDIALQLWQQGSRPNWQDWVDTATQLEAVSTLAAHVHLTTVELLRRTLPSHLSEGLVTPCTFIESLRMTQSIAVQLRAQEKAKADRLQAALVRLEEVDRSVHQLEQGIATLRPQLAMAEQEVQQKMALITAAKERYMYASRRCKFAEETIETQTKNVAELKKTVEEKFEEVSPLYHSALEALSSVQKNDVLEVMSYREPPLALAPIFDALCMLFDRPQTWEDCKQLLLSQSFFESLKFFDRDNVPKRKLKTLEKMITKNSDLELIEHGSKAVVPLHMWVKALVDYHKAKMGVQPSREELAEAERTLGDANATFIEMQKDMLETKSVLQEKVRLHKESVQKARAIEAEIESLQKKLDNAKNLLSATAKQKEKWDEQLQSTWSRIDSVPGHALLCAASACYLACVPSSWHNILLENWLAYCFGGVSLGSLASSGIHSSQPQHGSSGQHQVVRIQKDFSTQSVLATKSELSRWQCESVFPDEITLQRCLPARLCCCHGSTHWPLIFDPHGQFLTYLSALHEDSELEIPGSGEFTCLKKSTPVPLSSSAENIIPTLVDAMSEGKTVALVLDPSPASFTNDNREQIDSILRRNVTSGTNPCLQLGDKTVPIHAGFKLHIVLEQALDNYEKHPSAGAYIHNLSDFCVINLSLSAEGLKQHLQRVILRQERPEYGVRYKSLLTDLGLHQQEIEDSQEAILKHVTSTEGSVFASDSIIPVLEECEAAEMAASEHAAESKRVLRVFEQQVQLYKPLVDHAATAFSVVQRLSNTFKYFGLGLNTFERLLATLFVTDKKSKVPENALAITGHVLHLKHQLLMSLMNAIRIYTFTRHQRLLPLFVSLEILVSESKLSREEYNLLAKDLDTVERQLDMLLSKGDSGPVVEKPQWITDKVWCGVLHLQRLLPSCRRLALEISNNSEEWKEYFELPPSLLAPLASLGDNASLGQKLLLWRTFQPDKFSEVTRELVLLVLGSTFTTLQASDLKTILPHTRPSLPVVCMLPDDRATDPGHLEADLSAAANECGRSLHCTALVNQGKVGELRLQLAQLMNEGAWVVLQHSHLCPNWKDTLESLFQIVCSCEDVHPEFRLLALLPVGLCNDLHCCQKVALEAAEQTMVATGQRFYSEKLSLQLLEDVQLVLRSDAGERKEDAHLQQWESHRMLVSKLHSYLPSPLADSELEDMNILEEGHSHQSFLALLYEELCRHNNALIAIHASVQTLLSYLAGDLSFTAEIGDTLAALSRNAVPLEWMECLMPLLGTSVTAVRLIPVLTLLRSRIWFYSSCLQSGTLPHTANPLWFSRPADLLSRLLHEYALQNQLSHEELTLQAQLYPAEASPEASELETCITFPGLTLHGGRWNIQRKCLEAPKASCISPPQCYSLAIAISTEQSETSAVQCPVVAFQGGRSQSVLCQVPLELGDSQDEHTWQESVYLSCSFQD